MLIRPFALERWGDTLGFCWQPVWAAGRVQAPPLVNFPGQRSFAVMPSSHNSGLLSGVERQIPPHLFDTGVK